MTTSVETQERQDTKRPGEWINAGLFHVFLEKIRKIVYKIIHFQPPSIYFSLRWKLLIGFTVIFSVVFALAFYWFYQFATFTALTRIQDDLTTTLQGATSGVNTDELAALVQKSNAAGLRDDPRFQNQLNWLNTIHKIEPRAWPYIYAPGSQPGEIAYLVDFFEKYDPLRGTEFAHTGSSKEFSLAGLERLTLHTIDGRFDPYSEGGGRWVSAYAPIQDENGRVIAAMGIDFQADYVDQVHQSILDNVAFAFLLTYTSLFVLVFLFSRALTRPIVRLTRAAKTLGEGDYAQSFSNSLNTGADLSQAVSHNDVSRPSDVHSTDEIDVLANAFDEMTYHLAERTVELERTNMLLKEIDRTKVGFIEISGHELRTPLTLIKGYAQMLQKKSSGDQEAGILIKGMLDGTDRLSEIVNNMLDVSKIDSKVLKVVTDNIVQLSFLIMKEQSVFQHALQERNLTLHAQALNTLPPIQADPHLLSKVFYHLIMNAIKYTPDGGTITISGRTIEDSPEPPEVEIVVCDTGIGIAPEYHELIFEKFFQTGEVMLHSSGKTKFKGGGPGLGLAIVRGIVTAHNGRVWVESTGYSEETYPGSAFHVRLPVYMNCQNDGCKASVAIEAHVSLPA